MQLKLEYLAPYLPYGLKLHSELFDKEYICKGIITTNEGLTIFIDDNLDTRSVKLSKLKLILRPMSDFDKMGLAGEDHYSHLSKINKDIEGGWMADRDLDFIIDQSSSTSYFPAKVAYNLYEYVFENHFDVFGLIPAGLAIDINTL